MARASSVRRLPVVAAVLALLAGALLGPAAEAAPPADAGPKTMVALGDSYAAGPLIPPQVDERPLGCLRSSLNYAHQVARALALELTDVTCSGASTKHMTQPHGVFPDDHPPQLLALRPDTDVVTLQIGGNDIGFGGIATTCGEAALRRASCEEDVRRNISGLIDKTEEEIRKVLTEIHERAPGADVYVLGYPGIFRIGPTASCPAMGVGEGDAQYLRALQEELNAMIRRATEASDETYRGATTYVDVYGPSAGHTACDAPLIRWVEPFVPVHAAAPVHPNLGGMTAIRDLLIDEIWPEGLPRRPALPGLPAPPDAPA